MNLSKRIELARKRLNDDKAVPDAKKNWQDWELVEYATDADREIARRARCLVDSDTIGYVRLSGMAGQVDSIVVSTVTITTGAVSFTTDLATLAEDLAANINAKAIVAGTPAYRALARDRYVVIKAIPNTGYPASGYAISATASGGITVASTRLSGLCRHIITSGQRYVPIHKKIIEIKRFKPASQSVPVSVVRKDQLDSSVSTWETAASASSISRVLPDYDQHEALLYPPRDAAELIEQDCIRLPLYEFSDAATWETGELPEELHMAAVDWMLRLAYLKNDEETFDPQRAAYFEAEAKRRIEDWKIDNVRRTPAATTNSVPGGMR